METEQAMSRIIADMGSISKGQVSVYLSLMPSFFLPKKEAKKNSTQYFNYSAS